MPAALSHPLQLEDVCRSAVGSFATVFVFDLHTDDRTAVFPKQSFNLLPDLLVEIIDETKEARVGGSRRALFHHPIRKAAVARLSMYPWPDAHV